MMVPCGRAVYRERAVNVARARATAGGHFGVVLRRVESLFQAGDVAGPNEARLRTSPTAPNDANPTERSLPMV